MSSSDAHDGQDHSSPYPVSRLAPTFDLVDVAREIQQANKLIGHVATAKLEIIARQIRTLQQEARGVLDQARRDLDLHQAKTNMKKRAGQTYHLYRRPPDDELYFSLLSPGDWRGNPPHEFVGSYRLEADMSWTPAEDIEARELERIQLGRLLQPPADG